MKVLLLAPHPFYQDRGTPIAVDMIVRVIAERGDQLDVITYHEGRDINYGRVSLHRIPSIPFVHHVRPGFSWKKVLCDIVMFFKVLRFVSVNRYDLVYSVEESVFMALLLKWFFKIPYVYDMDSSLAQQMVERYPVLSPFTSLFEYSEGLAVKNAIVVAPVCDALSSLIEKHHPRKVVVLQDVSLLDNKRSDYETNFKTELGLSGLLIMYIGNLEIYQGIDLLLDSFSLLLKQTGKVDLVIIGGEARDIQKYQRKCRRLGLAKNAHFLGPKPVEYLSVYVSQADILVSPRIKGTNTPMKVYSYLHSGKAVLVTDLPTHSQVLDEHVVMLADPSPQAFSKAMLELVNDKVLRDKLGGAGKKFVEENHNPSILRQKLNNLFDWIKSETDR